jgi:hypothetical protein
MSLSGSATGTGITYTYYFGTANPPTVTVTSGTQSGLTASTTYYAKITATNTGGSCTSTVVSLATTAAAGTAPSMPSLCTFTGATGNNGTANWGASATGSTPITYNIIVNELSMPTSTYVSWSATAAGSKTWASPTFAAGTSYRTTVYATNAYGTSATCTGSWVVESGQIV